MVKHDSDLRSSSMDDSSSSDSETDEQYSDDNRTSHDSIIKQLEDIKHALKIHHDKHGGSIKLGKAFHNVGHEVMSGLELIPKHHLKGGVPKHHLKGGALIPKHRKQDTSDSPIKSLKFGEMEISSDHPLLNKLSTSDVEDFTKLFEMSKGKKKMDNKKYEALRKLIIKKLKDSVHTESIKKVDVRFTRIVKGSDAAKEWAAKMKTSRSEAKAARDLKRK